MAKSQSMAKLFALFFLLLIVASFEGGQVVVVEAKHRKKQSIKFSGVCVRGTCSETCKKNEGADHGHYDPALKSKNKRFPILPIFKKPKLKWANFFSDSGHNAAQPLCVIS
ncbi:hypothetical protein M9H77_28182 [Catharanthus roseus]|uniref:Uncharacterized protein n=1 Tax=Catharanthus roseus TaxID=4058 RepID=A0ACC0AFJ7_CATRO|nr:hypothetical protein M9H77_28182 [Catharanthus roseus]